MTRPHYFDKPRWAEPGRAHRARRWLHRAGLYPWWDRYLERKIDEYNQHRATRPGDWRASSGPSPRFVPPVAPTPDPPGVPHPLQPTMDLLDPSPLGQLRRRRAQFEARTSLDMVNDEFMTQVVAGSPADLLVVDELMKEPIGGASRRTLLGLLRDRHGVAKACGPSDRPNPSGSGTR